MAFAAEKGAQFGMVWGLSVTDADNTNAFQLSGVKGSAYITSNFSLGGYYFLSDSSGEPSSTDKFTYGLQGMQAAYMIPASNGETTIGLRVGLSKIKQSPSGTDLTFSPYHYGVAVGYDYALYNWLAVGFEGSFLHVLSGKTTLNGTTYERDPFNIISFLVAIQFRI